MNVARLQALAANGPVAAFEIIDAHPGDLAHGFAFDGEHGVGDALDHFGFLIRRENVFDEINRNQRHFVLPSSFTKAAQRRPCEHWNRLARKCALEDFVEIAWRMPGCSRSAV